MLNPSDVDRGGMTGWEFFSIFFRRSVFVAGRKKNEEKERETNTEREKERRRESGKKLEREPPVKELERNSESCCSVKQVTERESRASLRKDGGGGL